MIMEIEGDIHVLLETISCRQYDNPTAVKDALLTLASMCTSNASQVKFMMRKAGAILLIYKIGICSSPNEEVMNASLYALGCAIENCDFNQRELTCPPIFNHLSTLLNAGFNVTFLNTLAFFLVCLVSNNALAQTLMRTSDCLKVILELYKNHSPSLHDWSGDKQKLWKALSFIINGCCSCPQNDDNQRFCSTLFPHSLQVLDMHGVDTTIVTPITSLLGNVVTNNVYNQDRLVKCGGIQSLCNVLHRAVNRLSQGQEYSEIAIAVINVLEYVIADNVSHAEKCGDHDLVMLLLKLLQNVESSHLSVENQSQIAITIVNLVENSPKNQSSLIETNGIGILGKVLADSKDETLTKAIRYVFEKCMSLESISFVHNKNLRKPMSDIQNRFASGENKWMTKAEFEKYMIGCKVSTEAIAQFPSSSLPVNSRDPLPRTLQDCNNPVASVSNNKTQHHNPLLNSPRNSSPKENSEIKSGDKENLVEKVIQEANERGGPDEPSTNKVDVAGTCSTNQEISQQCKTCSQEGEIAEENSNGLKNRNDDNKLDESKKHSKGNGRDIFLKPVKMLTLSESGKAFLVLEPVGRNNDGSFELDLHGVQNVQQVNIVSSERQNLEKTVSDKVKDRNRSEIGKYARRHDSVNTVSESDFEEINDMQSGNESEGSEIGNRTDEETIITEVIQDEEESRCEAGDDMDGKNSTQESGDIEEENERSGGEESDNSGEEDENSCEETENSDEDSEDSGEENEDDEESENDEEPKRRCNIKKSESETVEVVPPSECSSSRSDFEREVTLAQNRFIINSSINKVNHWLNTSVTSDVEDIQEAADENAQLSNIPDSHSMQRKLAKKTTARNAVESSVKLVKEPKMSAEGDAPIIKTNQSRPHRKEKIEEDDTFSHGSEIKGTDPGVVPRMGQTLHKRASQVVKQPKKLFEEITPTKRPRVRFTKEEEANIMKGVTRLGRSWTLILQTYKFRPCRTATDLRDKYRRLMQGGIEGDISESVASSNRRARVDYSRQEEVNLLKGVERMGKFWKQILDTYEFHPIRTAVDLKDKYKRMMNSKKLA